MEQACHAHFRPCGVQKSLLSFKFQQLRDSHQNLQVFILGQDNPELDVDEVLSEFRSVLHLAQQHIDLFYLAKKDFINAVARAAVAPRHRPGFCGYDFAFHKKLPQALAHPAVSSSSSGP